jgi:hypothetical protein
MRIVLRRCVWIALSSLFVATSSVFAQTAKPPAHPTFGEMVEQHFPQWDRNHDGRFDAKEIDHWMEVKHVHGAHAAALATVRARMRTVPKEQRPHFAITQAELLVPEGAGPVVKPADAATGEKEHRFSYSGKYKQLVRDLDAYVAKLFAADSPDPTVLKQGPIGDCFFFSITGAMAAQNPRRILSMIERERKGGYLVKLGLHSIRVREPTDAEAALNNSASTLKDGHWVIVLEEAVGKVLAENNKDGKLVIEKTDMIAFGGSPRRIIEIYTGHHVHDIPLRDPAHERERLTALRRELTIALRDRRLVGVGMHSVKGTNESKTPGLGYGHAYGVLTFDAMGDKITIWNPWGNTFKPKGPDGLQHGYRTQNGIFEVPLHEFYKLFSVAHFETDKKLTPSASNTKHIAAQH